MLILNARMVTKKREFDEMNEMNFRELPRGDTKKERDFEEIVTSVRRNL